MADHKALGTDAVVQLLSSALKPTEQNEHATLITLHTDWLEKAIECVAKGEEGPEQIKESVDDALQELFDVRPELVASEAVKDAIGLFFKHPVPLFDM